QSTLPDSTVMTLAISGIKDIAGNTVTGQSTQFITAATPQSFTSVSVLTTNPPSNTTNIPTNAAIGIQTNGEIDPTTVNINSFVVHDNLINQNVIGTYSQSADGMTLYFVPSGPLATGRSYTVSVGSPMMDIVGNSMSGYNFSFTTGVAASATGPTVNGV